MLYSVYPTDTKEVIEKVFQQVKEFGEKELFTSLHIPESSNLKAYLEQLKVRHIEDGLGFTADVSPLTFQRLEIPLYQCEELKTYGIHTLRIDFGFTTDEIRLLAEQGFKIAVNSSVVDRTFLEELKGIALLGWHNYYPRPETALTEEFYQRQNRLFRDYGFPLLTFIPGDREFRAPLALGLPTLECQRYQNAYMNYVSLAKKDPDIRITLAEGTLHPEHGQWIKLYEEKGIITVPITGVNPLLTEALQARDYFVRVEEAQLSWRIEESRKALPIPENVVLQGRRYKGNLVMDTSDWGRYEGELHIMRQECDHLPGTVVVGQIAQPYLDLTQYLGGHPQVRFVCL